MINVLESDRENVWIVIPARQGSVGFPNKNRLLFEYTALQVPEFMKERTIVTTDDEILKKSSKELGFNVVDRPEDLATSIANTRDVIAHVKENSPIKEDDTIIMLYLTFPERTLLDVERVYNFYKKSKARSVLCKSKIDKHPYLCLYEGLNNTGKQVVEHDLYRRQDYPKCFFVLHYVFICKASEIDNLNKNLYNDDTLYFPIERKIDIDDPEHFESWRRK